MTTSDNFLSRLFGSADDSTSSNKKRRRQRGRTCRIEELESREMLDAGLMATLDDVFDHAQRAGGVIPPTSQSEIVIVDVGGLTPPALAPTYDTLSQGDFDDIRTKYTDLDLSDNVEDYFVTEISADDLSDDNLRSAIAEASTNGLNNLIVLHTTVTQNKITLTAGQLEIPTGNITIVSQGTEKLTIDANKESRVFEVGENATVALAGLTITGSHPNWDAGGISNSGALTISDCVITGNSTYCHGGILNVGTLLVTNTSITGNSAMADGGGITNKGALTIVNSIISDNSAEFWGGGIFNDGVGATLIVLNCVISGNSAEWGGGILNIAGTATLTNCTIAKNSTGIYVSGGVNSILTIYNTIVAQNTDKDVYDDGGTLSGNNNLIGNGAGQTAITDGDNGNLVGVDPMFAFTEGQDWNQWDFYLLPGSPAIDAGDNDFAVDADGNPLTGDLTGNPRIYNGTVDMGAYEYCPDVPIVNPLSPPTNLKAVVSGAITLSVSWDAVAHAIGYEIQYSTSEDFANDRTEKVDDGLATSFDITVPTLVNTTYYVRIKALGDDTEYSESGWATTTSEINVTATSVTVTWAAVNNATRYEVRYRESGATEWTTFFRPFPEPNTSGTVTDLTPNTLYEFQVKANNVDKWPDDKDAITARTLLETPVLYVIPYDSDSFVFLVWNDVPGAEKYELEYKKFGEVDWTVAEPNGPTWWFSPALDVDTGYDFRVRAFKDSEPANNSVWGTAFVVSAPTDLRETNTTADSITLAWNAPYVPGVPYPAQYEIRYRAVGTDEWRMIGAESWESWSKTVPNLTADAEYEFLVQAIYNGGMSWWSESAYARTLPKTPTPFQCTGNTMNSVTLSWGAVDAADIYYIEYCDSQEWIDWKPLGSISGTSITISDLADNTEYAFRICASVEGRLSDWATLTTRTLLIIPTGLQSYVKTSDSVTLKWNGVAGADNYDIQFRRVGTTAWTSNLAVSGTSGDSGITGTVSGLTSGIAYEFRIRASNEFVKSDWSEGIFETTLFLASPTGLRSTGVTEDSITLSWNSVSNAFTYDIQYRRSGTTSWTTMTPSSTTSRTITDLTADTEYEFQVRASGATEKSAWAKLSVITTLSAPTGLKITNVTENSVVLTWNPVVNAINYDIQYRRSGITAWTTITAVTETTRTVIDLVADTDYEFQIRASNVVGKSAWAQSAFAKTLPTPPMGFQCTDKTSNSISLSWNGKDDGITKYEIRYRALGTTAWTTPAAVLETSRTVTGLKADTEYEFQIRALNVGGNSAWSPRPLYTATLPVAPGNFRCTAKTQNSITLAWNSVAGAMGYTLEYKQTGSDSSWLTWTLGSGVNVTKATLTGLATGKEYDFRLMVITNTGGSSSSAITVSTAPVANPVKPKVSVDKKAATTSSVVLNIPTTVSQNASYIIHVIQAGTTKHPSGFLPINVDVANDAAAKLRKVEITGLKPNTTYKFSITAVNESGKTTDARGKFVSVTVSAKTTKFPAISKVKPVKDGISPSSVTLSWTASKANHQAGATTGYVLYWLDGKTEKSVSEIKEFIVPASVSISGTTATINGLKASTKYTFVIREVTKVGGLIVGESLATKVSVKTAKALK